jgi:hypothetical protein
MMNLRATYGSAPTLLVIISEHEKEERLHLALLETIRQEFSDVPAVVQAIGPRRMLTVLRDLSIDMHSGRVRSGDDSQRMYNYGLCAKAHSRLMVAMRWQQAAA